MGSAGGLAQEVLELCEDLLDRVEVGGVGRQEQQMRARSPDRGADGLSLVAAEVVEDNDVAGPEGGDQRLLDPGGEAVAVDRAVEQAGRVDAVAAQGRKEGQCAPMAMRMSAWQTLAARGPAAQGGHVRLDPGFIKKDQPLRVNLPLMLLPPGALAGDLGAQGLAGEHAFF